MTTRILSSRALRLVLASLLVFTTGVFWPQLTLVRYNIGDERFLVVHRLTGRVDMADVSPGSLGGWQRLKPNIPPFGYRPPKIVAAAQQAVPQEERFAILRAAVDSGWRLRWVHSVTVYGDSAYVDIEMIPEPPPRPTVTYIPPWPPAQKQQQSRHVYRRLVVRRNGVWSSAHRDSSNVIESTCIGSGPCTHPPRRESPPPPPPRPDMSRQLGPKTRDTSPPNPPRQPQR